MVECMYECVSLAFITRLRRVIEIIVKQIFIRGVNAVVVITFVRT